MEVDDSACGRWMTEKERLWGCLIHGKGEYSQTSFPPPILRQTTTIYNRCFVIGKHYHQPEVVAFVVHDEHTHTHTRACV